MSIRKIELLLTARNMTAKAFRAIGQSMKSIGAAAVRAGKAAAVALGVIGGAALAVGKKMVGAYQIQAAAEAKLAGVLKTTGYAAGVTLSQMKSYASELQNATGVGDETTLSMMGLLASFRGIGDADVFKRATAAIIDMSAAFQKAGKSAQDVENGARMIGRALDNPIVGITALTRYGIVFTDAQKEQIKTMQESGDMIGAQGMVLQELEGKYGGVAGEVSKAQHGIKQLVAAWGDAYEEIGKVIVETEEFDGVISKITESIQALEGNGHLEQWAENARAAIDFLMPAINGVGKALSFVGDVTAGMGAFLGALSAGASLEEATKAITEIPEQHKEDQKAKLRDIQAKKKVEADQKANLEWHAMQDAKLAKQKEEAAKNTPAAKAAQKAADDAKAMADLKAKIAIANEKARWDELIALHEKKAKLEVDIEKAKQDEILEAKKKGIEDQLAADEKALEEATELAKRRVEDVIDENKKKEDHEKGLADDQKKADKLRGMQASGIKISKRDQEFLKQAEAIANAGAAVPGLNEDIERAKKSLAELGNQTKMLNSLLTEQKANGKMMKELMAAG